MALIRSRRRQNPLELHGVNHIREATISQVFTTPGVVGLVAGSEDDSPHVQLNRGRFLVKIDGLGLAHFLAYSAVFVIQMDAGVAIDYGLVGNGLRVG